MSLSRRRTHAGPSGFRVHFETPEGRQTVTTIVAPSPAAARAAVEKRREGTIVHKVKLDRSEGASR